VGERRKEEEKRVGTTAKAFPPSAPYADELKSEIASFADFPVAGIDFKDITPLLESGEKFASVIDGLSAGLREAVGDFDVVLAVESRGFVFGAPLAGRLRRGLVLVRKPGKLPGAPDRFPYTCEYCSGTLEIRDGAVQPGGRYLVVDDLLATGGTARAVADYVVAKGGEVAGFCFAVELSFLDGRAILDDAPVVAFLVY
jgi:adenine phosphoribosyltransferase